jgi:conserved hypothetical protein
MLCVTAIYPNAPDSRFDTDYYLNAHTKLARGLLEQHGLTDIRTSIGIAALDGSPAPYWAISEMHFASRDRFDAAMSANGDTLFADLPNYTNVDPILQFSELASA